MKTFDIDVSGEDLLSKDYAICVADDNGIIKGFKFSEELIKNLCSNQRQGYYRYKNSKTGKTNFKIRLYCIVVYSLFKSIKFSGDIFLNVCRDFNGKENDIKENLKFFLSKLNLNAHLYFAKLMKNSNAHKYSFLMREDRKSKMNTYVAIKLEDFEKWLK